MQSNTCLYMYLKILTLDFIHFITLQLLSAVCTPTSLCIYIHGYTSILFDNPTPICF